MEGYGRIGRARPSAAVYRRRRLMAVTLLALTLSIPWYVTRGEGDGDTTDEAVTAASPEVCVATAARLPLRARLALTLMVGVDGDAPDDVLAVLEGPTRPGGIFVRGGRAVWDDLVLAEPLGDDLPLLVAVDDEGGRVQPMTGVLDDLASAAELAEQTPESLSSLAAARGAQLGDLGVNVVLGPVLDVGGAGGIGDRSFGDTSDVVIVAAGAYAAGLREAGILPVLKHFPGQGHAAADTHEAPAATPPLSLLRTSDLVPYDVLLTAGPSGVMVGHVDVPELTEAGRPASLSPAAIGLLRGGYEFDGLVVTDDLVAMQAVRARFEVPDAAERALAAGADVLLLSQPTDVGAVLNRLEEAVNLGRVPARRVVSAVGRVAQAGCPG